MKGSLDRIQKKFERDGLINTASAAIETCGDEVRAPYCERKLRQSSHPTQQAIGVAATRSRKNKFSTAAGEEWDNWIQSRLDDLAATDRKVPHIDILHAEETGGVMHEAPLKTVKSISDITWSVPEQLRFLYNLTRELQPETVVELGSSVGASTSYFAAACACNGHGRVIAHEGIPSYATIMHRTIDECELNEYVDARVGLFGNTVPETLDAVGSVDIAYIDGNHYYEPTMEYFDWFCQKNGHGTMLIFDDIDWSTEMEQAWADIKTSNEFVPLAEVLEQGIGIVSEKGVAIDSTPIRVPSRRIFR